MKEDKKENGDGDVKVEETETVVPEKRTRLENEEVSEVTIENGIEQSEAMETAAEGGDGVEELKGEPTEDVDEVSKVQEESIVAESDVAKPEDAKEENAEQTPVKNSPPAKTTPTRGRGGRGARGSYARRGRSSR